MLGIEAACGVTLLLQIITIAVCSSARPLKFLGVIFTPWMQVVLASWAFVGIPITIAGGVGALHRIGGNIRALFYYQVASFVVVMIFPIWFLTSSSMCDMVVAPEVQNQGSAFICGFADSFVFAWSLMLGLTHAYIIYIIWSAAEDIRLYPNPELMRYEEALKGTSMPESDQPTGPTPEMFARAAYAMPGPGARLDDRPFAGPPPGNADQGPGMVSMALDAAAAQRAGQGQSGVPQSFFPAPASGIRLESNVR